MAPKIAVIALGSNLGDSVKILTEALARLEQFSAVPLARASLWQSSPIDCPPGSPPFINTVAMLTPLPGETPETLLAKLKSVELEFGRRPKVILNEPRPLDLDLILFGDEARKINELTLPHPRAHLRKFVLQPLSEIVPELIFPGTQKTVSALLEDLGPDQVVTRL